VSAAASDAIWGISILAFSVAVAFGTVGISWWLDYKDSDSDD
jgi:hypothetical protein